MEAVISRLLSLINHSPVEPTSSPVVHVILSVCVCSGGQTSSIHPAHTMYHHWRLPVFLSTGQDTEHSVLSFLCSFTSPFKCPPFYPSFHPSHLFSFLSSSPLSLFFIPCFLFHPLFLIVFFPSLHCLLGVRFCRCHFGLALM